jgi:serine protease
MLYFSQNEPQPPINFGVMEREKCMPRSTRSLRSLSILAALAMLIVLGPVAVSGAAPRAPQRRPLLSTIPPGYSTTVFDVKLRDELRAPVAGTLVSAQAAASRVLSGLLATHPGVKLSRLFTVAEARLDALRVEGLSRAGGTLPDLNLWFRATAPPGGGGAAFMRELAALEGVEIVETAPLPMPPPATTPNFTASQGYLGPAPDGIGAQAAWALAGGTGAGVRIIDVEYSWNQSHEDLDKAAGLALLLNGGDSNSDPFSDNNHGTAVLGELIATRDSIGVTGISYGADLSLAPARTANLGYSPANAIILATANSAAGDVILIEQQIVVCGLATDADCLNCGPLEWTSAVFTAIQAATAAGRIVVEAAGNGGTDLDQVACGTTFNRTVKDSGAIIVGAGGSAGSVIDLMRLAFSCYGSRLDVQGWGDAVMTTGYDGSSPNYHDPDDPTNPDRWYRRSFAGTSSASPIVAGAATNIQAIRKANSLGLLTSTAMRTLLTNTGTAQRGAPILNIGPRPNIRAALAQTLSSDLSVTKSGPATTFAGGGILYTITAHNGGPTGAQFVSLTDMVPTTTTFQSLLEPSGWSCTTPPVGDPGSVVCTKATMANGETATFSLLVQTSNLIGSVSDQATIACDNGDPSTANDTSPTVTTAVLSPADVHGTKVYSSSAGSILSPGAPLTYTIVLANTSAYYQFDNPGFEFSDTLPAQLTLVGAGATGGGVSVVGNTVNWNGMIAGGASVVLTVDALINAGTLGQFVSNQGGTLCDADGDGVNESSRPTDDPGVAGAADATVFQVLSPADVRGTKVYSSLWGNNLYPGAPVTYTILLTNNSAYNQFDNPGQEFSDTLPPQLTLVGAIATGGSVSTVGNTVSWSGMLAGGASVTLTVDAMIKTGTSGQTVSNQGGILCDADGDGVNESSRLTDDPAVPGTEDPTVFQVLEPVPTLSDLGLFVLGLALLAAGLLAVSRRSA